MTKVVKAEVGNVRLLERHFPGSTDVGWPSPTCAGKYQVGINAPYSGVLAHQAECQSGEGYAASFPVLGVIECDDAALQVYDWPGESEQLHFSGACCQGEGHHCIQVRVTACLTGA
jgi:hypothetical protein